ncbi:PREDICTED: cathepsin B-like cysteine proteinase 5 [Diuraphis noxia]|uniref:cathepsin B-like cysteine proteinase 5 n=1 Tax=Diuraphis noxia TaxID=143948 RepID=UPI0007639B06|nr:PREDICTED: cathepsin B-like cysteine proteinase 5 [Diuraphis noxia]
MNISLLFSSCAVFIFLFSAYASEQTYFLNKDYISKINSVARTWKVGINFHPETPLKFILRLLGSKGVQASTTYLFKSNDPLYKTILSIPKEFDARKRWKNCTTIGTIRDQGNCGSCWAFSTSGAFADRLCIASNGKFNQLLSAEQVTSCCYRCGLGCQGGYPIKAWQYYNTRGLVTGGNFNSFQLVKDFPYVLVYENIQKDMMIYGPIESSFDVYDDFISYKSGVYSKTPNATYLGGHSVKCIGWGVERNVPYWLMMNSWNSTWGDGGYFKIRRGTNECKVEDSSTAGVPEY